MSRLTLSALVVPCLAVLSPAARADVIHVPGEAPTIAAAVAAASDGDVVIVGPAVPKASVIIDGKEAFLGGHCIVDEWLGNAEDGKHFADVSVRLHGPIVHSIQGAFSENWAGETGELFMGDDVFPELGPAGDVLIHAVFAKLLALL